MDLDPMINTSQDENDYANYDNRPIRPMDQDALNEALARLPILVDEEDSTSHSEPNTSLKSRRQPTLAHSTQRKNFSGINISQSLLNTIDTPINNKRKLGGSTPVNKFIKQLDSRQDLIQLKEENKMLEENKATLQLECMLLKKSHETELETLKHEHQQVVEAFIQEREQFNATLEDKEQLVMQTNLELENLRNDQTMLLLEKETLNKIVEEYQLIKNEMNQKLTEKDTIIANLQNELESLPKMQQQKQSTTKSALVNGRMPLKETLVGRTRTPNNVASINRYNTKGTTTRAPPCPIPSSVHKPISSSTKSSLSQSKAKSSVFIEDQKKCLSTDKHFNSASDRSKPNLGLTK